MSQSTKRVESPDMQTVRSNSYHATRDREQNYIGRRISEARHQHGWSLSAFKAKLAHYGVDVSVAAINKWELGNSAPNAYQLLAVGQTLNIDDYAYFMSVGGHTQLNSEGLHKLASYREDLIASGRYKPSYIPHPTITYISMPVSNLAVSAGTGAFLDEDNFEMMDFPEESIPDGADFALKVSGDSMEPTYHDGQYVWVQRCDSVEVGKVGIFVYDGEGFIKVYHEQLPESGDIEDYMDSCGVVHGQPVLVSYNKKYAPRVVSGGTNFQIVGRVL